MSTGDNILSTGPGGENTGRLREEKLLAYLEGRLSAEEQHEVELWLADEGMESDAVEGLQEIAAPERKQSINKLNHKLHKAVGNKKRKRRKPAKDQNALFAVFLVLLLIIAAYLVIRYAR